MVDPIDPASLRGVIAVTSSSLPCARIEIRRCKSFSPNEAIVSQFANSQENLHCASWVSRASRQLILSHYLLRFADIASLNFGN